LLYHVTYSHDNGRTFTPNGLSQLPALSSQSLSSSVLDDETSSATNSQSKINPSEIPAEELSITCNGVHGTFTVNRGLTAKIYFQKKHFLWEFNDSSDTVERRRKRKIEIKFQDIRRMYVIAKEGAQGKIVIETTSPLTLYKEKSQVVKSTQWEKASNDFTNGFLSPKEGSFLTITTTFAKDMMTKRIGGKHSHLEKLLSSDPRLKKLIENDPSTTHDTIRDPLAAGLDMSDEHFTETGMSSNPVDNMNSIFSQEAINQFKDLSPQDLLDTCVRTLKPKKLPSASIIKYRFRCPAFNCGSKFNSDAALRDHLYQRHRNLVDMGITVAENGNFAVSHGFLVQLLAYERTNPQQVKQIVKNISYIDS